MRIADGRFVEVNTNWEAHRLYPEEALVAPRLSWVCGWYRATCYIIERTAMAKSQRGCHLQAQEGHLYYNKVSASVFESDGEKYMMLAVQDVTAQREAQQQIVELNQQLEQRCSSGP